MKLNVKITMQRNKEIKTNAEKLTALFEKYDFHPDVFSLCGYGDATIGISVRNFDTLQEIVDEIKKIVRTEKLFTKVAIIDNEYDSDLKNVTQFAKEHPHVQIEQTTTEEFCFGSNVAFDAVTVTGETLSETIKVAKKLEEQIF